MLNAATQIDSLRLPPANRLEKLRGDRAGQYSIRINDQWRICFHWAAAMHSTWRSPTTTRAAMRNRDFEPIHPGEILLEEFLTRWDHQYRLAKSISVPQRRISEIVQGKRAISADTALRLGVLRHGGAVLAESPVALRLLQRRRPSPDAWSAKWPHAVDARRSSPSDEVDL